jgi:hypothetical protein
MATKEIDMIESPTILTPASAQAEDARQAGAEPLNGNGFYRFKIGDFQATVISDGYGQIPVGPILATNASEAELAPVLKANFMQPVIQFTNNILVVETGRERILVDTGFGEKLGPSFGSFPGLEANLRRAGITPESIDLVVTSHCHLDHIGGLVTKPGALAFPKAQFVFVDTEWNYWTGSRYESEVNSSPMPDPFKKATIGAAREKPATGRRPIPVREARRRNHKRRALYCGAGTFAVPCLNLVHLGQGAVHAYG